MSIFNLIWIFINIVIIFLILLRSPNEQNLQNTIGSLKFFESAKDAEKNIDNLIKIFVFFYFVFGFLLILKAFY